MSELTLISQSTYQLRPLIEAALEHELRLLEAGTRQTEHRLRSFEEKYQQRTADFIAAYERDQCEETLELIEWLGESRLSERLQEKINALRTIHFAN